MRVAILPEPCSRTGGQSHHASRSLPCIYYIVVKVRCSHVVTPHHLPSIHAHSPLRVSKPWRQKWPSSRRSLLKCIRRAYGMSYIAITSLSIVAAAREVYIWVKGPPTRQRQSLAEEYQRCANNNRTLERVSNSVGHLQMRHSSLAEDSVTQNVQMVYLAARPTDR